MKRILCFFIGLMGMVSLSAQELVLWYDKPAFDWMNEALPVGNGYMGAMFFGGTVCDEIQLSEESMWAGGPGANALYNGGNKTGGWKHLAEIRELLKVGNKRDAARIADKYLTGQINSAAGEAEFGDYGAHQPFGSLYVTVNRRDSVYSDYRRSLDLEKAMGQVSYRMGTTDFRNEYFASYPARLVVVKYSNNAQRGEEYNIRFSSPHPQTVCRNNGKKELLIEGKLESNGLPFEGRILIKTDGRLQYQADGCLVSGAKYVELYVSIASAYRNEYPHYRGTDYVAVNVAAMKRANTETYERLKREHYLDYSALFNRVQLQLGRNEQETLPTDRRQLLYSQGAFDPALEALYFQYGRYLLISSSRPGTLPAHLQGRWNNRMNPPWACDYHININLQMIYWPAEVTNLSECHEPLLEYIDALREPGRVTAREYFNARGWSVHTMNNAYGYTAPGWNFNWGYAPNSAAWLCRHLWEHFIFTMDREFLQQKAYPIMKEVGQFWLDYLVEDGDGMLVSSPSYSPEHGEISIGAAIDQEIAWDLFTHLLSASEYVSGEEAFMDSIRVARERLSPLKIGQHGQLQEWKEDLDEPKNTHRHVSHLYALYPGCQITRQATPKLAKAAQRTLAYRGEEGTGWSLAWKINFQARLGGGNQSYKLLRNLLTPSVGKGGRMGSGSYSNLLCAHPPFQIDGNMGAVAGIAEMLLQSHEGSIELLPALPAVWFDGAVKGLKTRGGCTVDMSWKNGLLQETVIQASVSGKYKISYRDMVREVSLRAGESVKWSWKVEKIH